MPDVERFTGPAPDNWWAAPKPDTPADTYTEAQGAKAAASLGKALGVLDAVTAQGSRKVPDAARYLCESLNLGDVAATVATIQDLRQRLALLETYLAREAGQTAVELDIPREGATADGRMWVLKRGRDRKAWRHTDWQRDARAQVVAAIHADGIPDTAQVVAADTGEVWALNGILQAAMAAVEGVHGAQAPKVTALRKLDLDPDDYCESIPGTWAIHMLSPNHDEN